MKPTDIEHDLLAKALTAFQQETGLLLDVIKENTRVDGVEVDAIIQMPNNGQKFAVEFKKWAPQANPGALAEKIKRLPLDGLLVADYINPNMGNKLKTLGVQFIDAAGNTYINQQPIYIHVIGKKQEHALTEPKEGTNRAFDTTGLKVVFGLLCNPQLVKAAYRDIASSTGVALGTVGWVINGLKDAGFVVEHKKGRQLVNQRKLLDRWIVAYPEKLKPKQRLGEFIANDPNWWQNIDIADYGAYWGGEVAAAKYTNYLRPQTLTIYLPKEAGNQLLAKAKLHKAPDIARDQPGLVKIFRPFWPIDTTEYNHQGLVNPILVYADLIATGDARNGEAARMIYEQHIAKHIGEDTQ